MATFDFGSGTPLPPPVPQQPRLANISKPLGSKRAVKRRNRRLRAQNAPDAFAVKTDDLAQQFKPRLQDGTAIRLTHIPSLAARADEALLDYLRKRRLSTDFLGRIDDFLGRYPELINVCPGWCYEIATLPPLEAYLFFIRGYLRPATYVDGVVPPLHLINIPRQLVTLQTATQDLELLDFFDDCGDGFNMLGELDNEASKLARMYHSGWRLHQAEAMLLAMVIYAQPVDAFKFYEFCYRTIPNRERLGEHNILRHLRKQAPEPVHISPTKPVHTNLPKPSALVVMRTWRNIRLAMAKSNDKGGNIVHVLLDRYLSFIQRSRATRKRIPRGEIKRLRKVALEAIERERKTEGGGDLVDLVMGLATQARPNGRPSHLYPYLNNPSGRYYEVRCRQVASAVRHVQSMYELETRRGLDTPMLREMKKAEYHLADLVGSYARLEGTMNDKEYEYLRQVFPHRSFRDAAEYEDVNPMRYDVLLLLKKWI